MPKTSQPTRSAALRVHQGWSRELPVRSRIIDWFMIQSPGAWRHTSQCQSSPLLPPGQAGQQISHQFLWDIMGHLTSSKVGWTTDAEILLEGFQATSST